MELQKEIQQRAAFRRNVRQIDASEKELARIEQAQRRKAIEAEKTGNHTAAVRFAEAAERLGRQVLATADMKDTILATHAMQENTNAVTGLLRTVTDLSETAEIPDQADLATFRIGMETTREKMDMLMEIGEENMDLMANGTDSGQEERGEKILQKWLKTAEQEKRKNLLKETSKHLDTVMRPGTGE